MSDFDGGFDGGMDMDGGAADSGCDAIDMEEGVTYDAEEGVTYNIHSDDRISLDLETDVDLDAPEAAVDLTVGDIQSGIAELQAEMEADAASLDDKFEEQTDAPYANEEFLEPIATENTDFFSQKMEDISLDELNDERERLIELGVLDDTKE